MQNLFKAVWECGNYSYVVHGTKTKTAVLNPMFETSSAGVSLCNPQLNLPKLIISSGDDEPQKDGVK